MLQVETEIVRKCEGNVIMRMDERNLNNMLCHDKNGGKEYKGHVIDKNGGNECEGSPFLS